MQPWTSEGKSLTIEKILAWADAHHDEQVFGPSRHFWSGAWRCGRDWSGINASFRYGGRGLRGSSPCRGLLAGTRQEAEDQRRPRLTIKQILAWADEHHESERGVGPARTPGHSGHDDGEIGTTYKEPCTLECEAFRGSSIAKLLRQYRGESAGGQPRADDQTDPGLGDDHHRRTGVWPRKEQARHRRTTERWNLIYYALSRVDGD